MDPGSLGNEYGKHPGNDPFQSRFLLRRKEDFPLVAADVATDPRDFGLIKRVVRIGIASEVFVDSPFRVCSAIPADFELWFNFRGAVLAYPRHLADLNLLT